MVDTSAAPPAPTDQTSDALVELRGVDKHFGALHVLQHIDLTVRRGEVVVIIGPSGSGKSTLCRTINRLETIDSGTIALDGEPLPAEGRALARLRADVGMVFQSFNLFAHKTVLRERHARARSRPRASSRRRPSEIALDLLDRVGVAQPGRQAPRAALRRSAAARRHRPRARDAARRSCSSTSRPPRSTPR